MTLQEKQAIVEAAKNYIQEKKISQNELADRAGLNSSYMSSLVNGVFTFMDKRTGKSSDIKEIYFVKLAKAIDYKLKKEYWPMVETPQLIDVLKALTEAKGGKTRMIIGETGCGKTYSLNKFSAAYPKGTYVVTVSNADYQNDLLRKIQRAIGIDCTGSPSERLDKISVELSRRYDAGLNPVLIFDESEYLKIPALLNVKTIYDYLKDTCGIVLIGTDDLLKKLESVQSKPGMKQFYSRFKAGQRSIRSIDKKYSLFLSGKGYSEELIECIQKNASDYRGVSDYLIPALKEADRMGVELTAELFKTINYLQSR